MRGIRVIAIVLATFALDRITKFLLLGRSLSLGSSFVSNVIGIQPLQNFGLLASTPFPRSIILAVTGIVIGLIVAKLVLDIRAHDTTYLDPLAILLGGALGNFYDRLIYGYVFDWIIFFRRSVINLADIAIGVGILWLVIISRKKGRPGETDPQIDTH